MGVQCPFLLHAGVTTARKTNVSHSLPIYELLLFAKDVDGGSKSLLLGYK